MSPTYRLKLGDKVLGILKQYDSDMPWAKCRFYPTDAYKEVKPLFDAELQQLNREDDWSYWEQMYQKIDGLGLRLEEEGGGGRIDEFLLHIDGDGAWFRY